MSSKKTSEPTSQRSAILRVVLLLFALAMIAWFQRPDGRLHVFFPAVQGDAILIQTPHGQYVLIDGGADPSALANVLGKRMPFWQRDLMAVVLTAPDLRRLSGQLAAVQHYQAKRALVTPAALTGGNATVREWRRILSEQAGVQIRIADHRHVPQPRRRTGIEPQPQPIRILDLAVLFDGRRLEPDRLERAAAEPARLRTRPLEERDQRTGAAELITEVEVVAVRVVEVDGLLDQREAELVSVEVERPLRVGADTSDVVQARQLHDAEV